tara:strand:- start:640 stop:837 length:198 start_codon:yes stop_codon:yes gene_type:complete
LIEKAWAKYYGGYENINYGRSSEFLRDLTGAPAFEYEVNNPEIVNLIEEGVMEYFIMTTHSELSN